MKEKILVTKIIAELGFQWKNSPKIYIYQKSNKDFTKKWLMQTEITK